MATVFMRWLERRPAMYDRGIRLLTLGRLESLYSVIADRVTPGQNVLEIGCGTAGLTRLLAAKTDHMEAIDISADMLEVAHAKLAKLGLTDHVQFKRIDALAMGSHYSPDSFDVIVSSLAFSEFSYPAQEHVLRTCHRLLRPNGTLLLLDEVQPAKGISRILIGFIRIPLRLLTWFLTRTTTHPLKDVVGKLSRSGFRIESEYATLGGVLRVYQAVPDPSASPLHSTARVKRLTHTRTLGTIIRDAWALFFRVLPPYPTVEPGIYAIGNPDPAAPVLVTGNYDLTVRRVVKQIEDSVDAWVLVVDSAGINVWCGAGGGFLTADRVIGALEMSGLQDWHQGQHMILPQLCANGVDGHLIRERTGWRVSWGPVYARDISAYITNGFNKTEAMRTVSFPLLERLEMVSATLGLYGLMILIPILIFWPYLFWPTLFALLGLSYFYAVTLPLIPGRDGLEKSIPLAAIALIGLVGYSWISGFPASLILFRRVIGMLALSVFVAAEMQGMSPLMRGEQANWGWEALIALVLGGAYWLVPRLVGWSI